MTDWVEHPFRDAYELKDRELRARVFYIHAYGAEYMWGVIKCSEDLYDHAEIPRREYTELIAGDTFGEGALDRAKEKAIRALAAIRLGLMRKLCLRCKSEEWVPSERGASDVHVMNCSKCPNPEQY